MVYNKTTFLWSLIVSNCLTALTTMFTTLVIGKAIKFGVLLIVGVAIFWLLMRQAKKKLQRRNKRNYA